MNKIEMWVVDESKDSEPMLPSPRTHELSQTRGRLRVSEGERAEWYSSI